MTLYFLTLVPYHQGCLTYGEKMRRNTRVMVIAENKDIITPTERVNPKPLTKLVENQNKIIAPNKVVK